MKIINDPLFGFIRVPRGLLLDLLSHPAFYRLSRIKQLGCANVVYPGAQHTRFQHSLGAYHLMSRAINTLQRKGLFIFDTEAEATLAAILLHDIGHGPFSHVLEKTLTPAGITHEDITLQIMQHLNQENFHGQLTLAIQIFTDQYPKRFLHQLISSQLDVDRLDYLRRDAFFTGVHEGNIGSDRIIDMLQVVDDELLVEKKGIYSIENYLVARRLMYWQVYLHKTAVAAEQTLINTLTRAQQLTQDGEQLFATPALQHFLKRPKDFSLEQFLLLSDADLLSAITVWQQHRDPLLALLSSDFINRRPFKVQVLDQPPTAEQIGELQEQLQAHFHCDAAHAQLLMGYREVGKEMYNIYSDNIKILRKDGTIADVLDESDMLNIDTLATQPHKHYLMHQRME